MRFDPIALDVLIEALTSSRLTKRELAELLRCHEASVYRRLSHLDSRGYDVVRRGFGADVETTYEILSVPGGGE